MVSRPNDTDWVIPETRISNGRDPTLTRKNTAVGDGYKPGEFAGLDRLSSAAQPNERTSIVAFHWVGWQSAAGIRR